MSGDKNLEQALVHISNLLLIIEALVSESARGGAATSVIAGATKFLNDRERPYPPYARLGQSVLRHMGKGRYYRDAGVWSVHSHWRDETLVVTDRKGPMAWAFDKELVPCTVQEWENDNQGYLSQDTTVIQAGEST